MGRKNSNENQQKESVQQEQEATVTVGENLREGTIIKGYSGFYYVACDGVLYECSLRGKNRQKKVKFLPGDRVESVSYTHLDVYKRQAVAFVVLAIVLYLLFRPERKAIAKGRTVNLQRGI